MDTIPPATDMDDEESMMKQKKLQVEAMEKEIAAQEAEMSTARAWCDKFETAHADYIAQVEKTRIIRAEHVALTEKMERATEAAATSDGCSVSARVCLLRQAEMLVEEHEQLTITLNVATRLEKQRHEDLLQARVEATMHSKAQKGIHAESSEDEANMKAAIMLKLKEKAMKTMDAAPETRERDTLQEVEQDSRGYEKTILDLQEKLRVAEELRKKELEHVAALEEKAKQEAEAAKKLALEEENKKVELEAKKRAIEEQERKVKEEEAKKRAIEEKERKAKEEEAKKRAIEENERKAKEEEAKKRAIEEQERKAKEDEAKRLAIAEEQRLKDEAATRALEELQRGYKMAEEKALELASAASLNSKEGISKEDAEIKARQEELLRQANIQRDMELQKQDAKKRLEREQEKAQYREQLAHEATTKTNAHMATHGMHGGNVFAGQDSPHGFETPKRFAPPELTDEIKMEIDAENAKRKAEIEELEARFNAARRRRHEAREKAAELKMRSGVAPSESSPDMSRLEYFTPTRVLIMHCDVFHLRFICGGMERM